jgi:hypothetical protein
VPIIGFGIPEIPLFKDIEHSGHAELKLSVADEKSGEFVGESVPAIGTTKHDDYTLLIIIHFTRADVEKRQVGSRNRRDRRGSPIMLLAE